MTEALDELGESIAKGQRDRAALIRRFGFVPTSVLRLKRGELSASLFNYTFEVVGGRILGSDSLHRVDMAVSDAAKEKAEARRAAGIFGSVVETSHQSNRETISVMPAELPDFFVRYYARKGSTYLDPFAGHGVRMQVAALRGLNYYGMDLTRAYVEYSEAVIGKLKLAPGQIVDVTRGDSRHPDHVPDGCGDFSFTSPPYWDTEFYSDDPEQLGTGKTYDEFLDGMRDVYAAWHPKFKPGAWVVLNVNDLRRDHGFIPYHADLFGVMRAAGYRPADCWIVDGLVAGLPRAFAVSFNMRRMAPKVHEYALVFTA